MVALRLIPSKQWTRTLLLPEFTALSMNSAALSKMSAIEASSSSFIYIDVFQWKNKVVGIYETNISPNQIEKIKRVSSNNREILYWKISRSCESVCPKSLAQRQRMWVMPKCWRVCVDLAAMTPMKSVLVTIVGVSSVFAASDIIAIF